MKRLILLLILFVNLQIVITHEDMRLFSYSTASAQHMTREAGDNCHDDEIGWYFTTLPCEGVIVDAYVCGYCGKGFGDDKQARDLHEKECMERPIQCPFCGTYILFWEFSSHALMCPVLNESSGNENTSGGGSYDGGGSSGGNSAGGSSSGTGGSNSDNNNMIKLVYKDGALKMVHVPKFYEVLFKNDLPAVFVRQETLYDCVTACMAIAASVLKDVSIEESQAIQDEINWAVEEVFEQDIFYKKGLTSAEMIQLFSYMGLSSQKVLLHNIPSIIENGDMVLGVIHNSMYERHEVLIVGYFNYPDGTYRFQCMDPWLNKYVIYTGEDFFYDSFYTYPSSNKNK